MEATRRTSGDLYSIPVEYALKISWSKMTVQAETGMQTEKIPQPQNVQLFAGRHCIMGERNGTVKDVEISEELAENIFDKLLWYKRGFQIENYLKDKLGILFLKFDTETEMLSKINRITELVKVVYEDYKEANLIAKKMNIINKLHQPFVVNHIVNSQNGGGWIQGAFSRCRIRYYRSLQFSLSRLHKRRFG